MSISEPATGTVQRQCEVDGCQSNRWYGAAVAPSVYVCSNHSGLEACGIMTVGLDGEDFVLIDGVTYVVNAKLHAMSKHMVVNVAGVFNLALSTTQALRFEVDGPQSYIQLPESTLRSVIAI